MAALETQLIINADDRTAAAFASVRAKIEQLQSTMAAMDKVGSTPAFAQAPALAGPGAALAGPGAALKEPAAAMAAATDEAAAATRSSGDALASSLVAAATATAVFAGAVGAATGAITAGADYQAGLVKLRNAGIVGPELEAADKQALELSARYPNVGRVEALEEFRALRSVAGRPEEVPSLMPTVIAALSTMKSLGMDAEAMPNLYKAAETLGQTRDQEKFARFIDFFVKMQQYAGHTITPETVQKFAQQMKLSGAVVSDEFIEHMMFLLAQETGTRGGAGLAGILKEFSGHIGGKEAAEWKRLGFLKDEDVLYSKKGDVTGIKPGHNIANWEQALSDPDLFVWTKLVPAMEGAGITSPVDQIKEIQALFGNERAASVIGKLIQQEQQFKTHLANLQGVTGTAGADPMLQTATGGIRSTITQAQNLAATITQPLMTAIGDATSATARALGQLNIEVAQFMKGPSPSDVEEANRHKSILDKADDLVRSIHVGGPESSDQWHAQMRANASLWGAGYRPGDLEQEMAREHSRAVSSTPLSFSGASDWEKRAGALTMPPQQPAAPASVTVNGQAQIDHEITVRIEPSPLLTAIVERATQQSETTVPLIGGGTGRMDSDASPHRVGGIGAM